MGTLHIVWQPFLLKQVIWRGDSKPWLMRFWKCLSADHGLILESLVGLGTANRTCGKLPVDNILGTGIGPLLAQEGRKKQMAGELGPHHSQEQWPQDEGYTQQI